MKKQAFNPYLPSWEYIPDGEPYVFDGRVYVYGSHDCFRGHAYCLNDYVCWSAPEDDLGNWRYEGVIYKKTQDPLNPDGHMCLYAPDVTVGPDGRYYLYYVLVKVPVVSVAVCDTPAGAYEFYGYVHYQDGVRLGEKEGDEPQFDPGVMTEGDKTWLYTGFCAIGDTSRTGPMGTVLGPDMLTILEGPVNIAPSQPYSKGSSFEGHDKPAGKPMCYGGNNHGSIVEINGKWYIFYHRHTDGTNFSRQGCIEPITFREDGSIIQAEITSCGANGGPLLGKGEYPAYLACHLFTKEEAFTTGAPGEWMDCRFPKNTQDGRDGDEETGYIANMRDGAHAGFKYFACEGISRVSIRVRGYCKGAFGVKTAWDGPVLGWIPVGFSNVWKEYSADIRIPDGVQALYFVYQGEGGASLASFTLE